MKGCCAVHCVAGCCRVQACCNEARISEACLCVLWQAGSAKDAAEEDEGLCSICMDRPLEAQIAGCEHEVCCWELHVVCLFQESMHLHRGIASCMGGVALPDEQCCMSGLQRCKGLPRLGAQINEGELAALLSIITLLTLS